MILKPFTKLQILNFQTVVDDDSKFDENGEKFSKGVENWEKKKLFVISNF